MPARPRRAGRTVSRKHSEAHRRTTARLTLRLTRFGPCSPHVEEHQAHSHSRECFEVIVPGLSAACTCCRTNCTNCCWIMHNAPPPRKEPPTATNKKKV